MLILLEPLGCEARVRTLCVRRIVISSTEQRNKRTYGYTDWAGFALCIQYQRSYLVYRIARQTYGSSRSRQGDVTDGGMCIGRPKPTYSYCVYKVAIQTYGSSRQRECDDTGWRDVYCASSTHAQLLRLQSSETNVQEFAIATMI